MSSHQIQVSETLIAEIGLVLESGERMIVIDRVAGGLVAIHLREVRALVAALSELGGQLAADSDDAVEVFTEDLY